MNHQDEIRQEAKKLVTRRYFLRECGIGLGSLALASLMSDDALCSPKSAPLQAKTPNPLAPRQPHFPARAKRVIYLFQAGAPSQLDLFDYKPGLVKYNGQPVPKELVKDQTLAFIRPDAGLYASEFKFDKHGQSGAELSEALSHLPQVVDDIAIVK